MKEAMMPPAPAANLVLNVSNTAFGVESIRPMWLCIHIEKPASIQCHPCIINLHTGHKFAASTSQPMNRKWEDITTSLKEPQIIMIYHHWCTICINISLTLDVQWLSYCGLTRSISLLQMAYPLASPGHQQQWYWLCKLCRSFSHRRKDFSHICNVSMEEW